MFSENSNPDSRFQRMSTGSVSALRDRFEGQGEPPSPPQRPIHHPSLRHPFSPPSPMPSSHSPDPRAVSPTFSEGRVPLRMHLAAMHTRIGRVRPTPSASGGGPSTSSSPPRPARRPDSPHPGTDPRRPRSPGPVLSPTPRPIPVVGRRRRHRPGGGGGGGGEGLGAAWLGAHLGDEDEDVLLDRLANCVLDARGEGAGGLSPGACGELSWPLSARSRGDLPSPLHNGGVLDEDAEIGQVRPESPAPGMGWLLEQHVNNSDGDGEGVDVDDDGKPSISSSSSSPSSKRNCVHVEYLRGMLDGAEKNQEPYELPTIKEGSSSNIHENDGDRASSGKSTPVEESIAYLYGRIDEELLNWSPTISPHNSISRQE